MENMRFSISDAFSYGWQKTQAYLGFLIAAFILVFFIQIAFAASQYAVGDAFELLLPIGLIAAVVGTGIEMGFLKIALKIYDEEQPDYSDIFSQFHLFFKYFAAVIIYGIMVFIGVIFFVVPGIILAIQFYFAFYAIIDKEMGPIDALEHSAVLTRGSRWDIFAFFIAVMILNTLGALCFLIGLFITIPMSLFATAYIYRKLQHAYESVHATTAPAA